MTNSLRARLSVEQLDARLLPDATPVASVTGVLSSNVAYSSTRTNVNQQGRGTTHSSASDALADDVEFSTPLQVESFAIRYLAEEPIDAVVTFHTVDPTTGGPGAEVASFLLSDLPAGDVVRSVVLPEAARFTWEPTAGIYNGTTATGAGAVGGFMSVRFQQPDGTPLVNFDGGPVAANPAGNDVTINSTYQTGTLAGFWDLEADAYKTVVGFTTYEPRSQWLQVGGRPAGAILATFSLSVDQVRGGQKVTGTIDLAAPAPAGGLTIQLASSNPSVAGVPKTVFIPEGATRATFTSTTKRVFFTTEVTITATLGDEVLSDDLTITRR